MRYLLCLFIILIGCSDKKKVEYPESVFIAGILNTHGSQSDFDTVYVFGDGHIYNTVTKERAIVERNPLINADLTFYSGPKDFDVNYTWPATFVSIYKSDEKILPIKDSVYYNVILPNTVKQTFEGKRLGHINVLEYYPPRIIGNFDVNGFTGDKYTDVKTFLMNPTQVDKCRLSIKRYVGICNTDYKVDFEVTSIIDRYGNMASDGAKLELVLESKDNYNKYPLITVNGESIGSFPNPSTPGVYDIYIVSNGNRISPVTNLEFRTDVDLGNITIDSTGIVIGPVINSNKFLIPDGERIDIVVYSKTNATINTVGVVKKGYVRVPKHKFKIKGNCVIIVQGRGAVLSKNIRL